MTAKQSYDSILNLQRRLPLEGENLAARSMLVKVKSLLRRILDLNLHRESKTKSLNVRKHAGQTKFRFYRLKLQGLKFAV
jgi:hypothetical protein